MLITRVYPCYIIKIVQILPVCQGKKMIQVFSSECALFSCWFTDTFQIIMRKYFAKYILGYFQWPTGQVHILREKRDLSCFLCFCCSHINIPPGRACLWSASGHICGNQERKSLCSATVISVTGGGGSGRIEAGASQV